MFKPRDLFIHDGASLRRVHVPVKVQAVLAGVGAMTLGWTLVAGAQMAVGATSLSTAVASVATREAQVALMESKVAAMQADVDAMKREAKAHATRLEQRQAILAQLLSGEGDPAKLSAMMPAAGAQSGIAADITASFKAVEGGEQVLVGQAKAAADARYRETAAVIQKLGISPVRFHRGGMGGPYEPIAAAGAKVAAPAGQADPNFRALFNSWRRLDQLEQGIVSIPSAKPVENVSLTSGFGIRNDPFRGGAAMHAGIDIPGPIGTPIYATADGIVGRAQWASGYGWLVELEHGRGIQTRYGHLSKMIVAPGARVKRGQVIALMGSTGRSTGSHLHYEVRLDGSAINPMPFLRSSNYLVAMQQRAAGTAQGGPRN